MIVVLHWRDGSSSILHYVESVRELPDGVEVKCYGNDPVPHRYPVLKTFAVVKEE